MERIKQILLLVMLILAYVYYRGSKSQQVLPRKAIAMNYQGGVDYSNCLASASWFTKVDGVRKTEAPNEGGSSVFANNATVSNCDFHKWSWQKFLWLTNEVDGQPLFLDRLIQVSSSGEKMGQDNSTIILTDTAQASNNNDVLITPGYNGKPSSTVYYAMFMDTLMYNTMLKFAPMAKENPALVALKTFPVGALEVKTSWIAVNALADTATYFVTDGVINGKKARVALLGMHVVGVVENHPEFIWATFQHENLAPLYDWKKATPTKDALVTSFSNYPFFNKASTATIKNITTDNGMYTDVFSVYKYGVPVEKKLVDSNFDIQIYMETCQNGSENYNNIGRINESVKRKLSGVWNSYSYNGAIWIDTHGYVGTKAQAKLLNSKSYHLSKSNPSELTRGSVAAYNVTMETYVQVGFAPKSIHETKVGNLVNCFSCHNASGNNKNLSPLYMSHVFTGYLQHLQGASKKEIKQKHVDEIIAQFKLREK